MELIATSYEVKELRFFFFKEIGIIVLARVKSQELEEVNQSWTAWDQKENLSHYSVIT